MTSADLTSTWHQALAYSLLGRVPEGLAPVRTPAVGELADELVGLNPDGLAGLLDEVAQHRASGPWPYRAPADLMRGLGFAQFHAALTQLREFLGTDDENRAVAVDRPLDAAERRLVADSPPHHGA